ncbi:MAG: mechanosensitive ion channel [Maricaulis sp.]|uniref:mechanosensitive ion channel family protein n=1 Tax=Maricaulis sp. TaxID=1486257 RepID=UPI001B2373CB|nr:mechanosensitive ion channel domain-containing protein [Maricaulis sp.]MBO6728881.1 mechanosensitive ion channel [Maricaulis sp.]MBO6846913.1 mechanosensitive ion channel [Maricaulis sp.]MBO6876272.1 mechanosensitive ion channel [Maricaulis sp.]
MDPQEFMSSDNFSSLVERGIDAGTSLALAAAILIIGMMVAGGVRKTVRNAAVKSDRIDDTLGGFFASLAYYGIMAIVVIAVLNRFGVETTSLVAALGAATLAIGLALQGTLSNLAAGVMIILFRPYKLGDFVEVAGQAGSVKDITLFTTELATGDNKKVIVPNGAAWGDVITNYSANDTRRVDFTFSIDYSDDIDKAMKIIQDTLGADERVHKDPAVFTAVMAHSGSSVDIVTRVWCNSGDYWGVHFDAMKNVKEAFDKGGISIPYPHQVNVSREG